MNAIAAAPTLKAVHFLTADLRAGSGDEPAWRVGETRTLQGTIALCERGYHSCPSWLDALDYCPQGPVACVVLVSEPEARDETKQVSHSRTLVAAATAEATDRALRRFAADCARRALERERARGREPDPRSWAAVDLADRLAAGDEVNPAARAAARAAASAAASAAARDAASAAAWDAASAAARDAAWDAASAAARDAARDAAWAAAWDAEREWQRRRLAELLDSVVGAGDGS